MTRLTTRLSPEEMTFDPMFAPDAPRREAGRLSRTGVRYTFPGCERDLISKSSYDSKHAVEGCADVYCARGECVITEFGPGCKCDPGQVARSFTDLHGQPSITCVPETAPVDLEAGGLDLADICTTLPALEQGDCVNLAGFAATRCNPGAAAVQAGTGAAAGCGKIKTESGTTGARNYTAGYESLRICLPAPPSCDARYGWLEETGAQQRASVEMCDSSTPDPSWLAMPPAPTCGMGAGATSGTSFGRSPTSSERVAPRVPQEDTTRPRVTMKDSDCNVSALASSSAGTSAWILSALGLLRLRRRRR